MKKVRKAVIPAAGLGTRFLPATKAMPKEMLPIVDKPTIQYIVEEAIASGIEDIIIVTGRSKRSIEDHFDRNWELETTLREKGKLDLLRMIESVTDLADIHYVRQKQALGLGHAVLCTRKFVGDEPFAILLGDIIVNGPQPCLRQLLDVYEEKGSPSIAVEAVDWQDVEKYGVIDGMSEGDRIHLVKALVEKPKRNPPSNLAMIGRYVLPPAVFDILEQTKPGVGGEIQLTDALQELAFRGPLYAYEVQGKVYDVGDKLGYLKATVEYACRNMELRDSFERFLQSHVRQGQQRPYDPEVEG